MTLLNKMNSLLITKSLESDVFSFSSMASHSCNANPSS